MLQIIGLAILIYREVPSLLVNYTSYFALQNSLFLYPLNIGHISVQPADIGYRISDVDSMMVMILLCRYDTVFRLRFSKNGFSNLSKKWVLFYRSEEPRNVNAMERQSIKLSREYSS